MSTLYRPVLIETAEQAEALPVGSISPHPDRLPIEKLAHGTWWGSQNFEGLTNEEMVGDEVLVPIEAEEEHAEKAVAEGEFTGIVRLVTLWEEA